MYIYKVETTYICQQEDGPLCTSEKKEAEVL